jgi:hypothetical protein
VAALVLQHPAIRSLISLEAQYSAGSGSSSASSPLTTTARQTILELHRRRLKIRELQEALAEERARVDDIVLQMGLAAAPVCR